MGLAPFPPFAILKALFLHLRRGFFSPLLLPRCGVSTEGWTGVPNPAPASLLGLGVLLGCARRVLTGAAQGRLGRLGPTVLPAAGYRGDKSQVRAATALSAVVCGRGGGRGRGNIIWEGARAASFRARENKCPPARICGGKKKNRSAVEKIGDLKAGEEGRRVRGERSSRGTRGLTKACGPTSGAALGFPTARTPRPAGYGEVMRLYPRKAGAPSPMSAAAAVCQGSAAAEWLGPVPSRPAGGRVPRLLVPPPLHAAGLQAPPSLHPPPPPPPPPCSCFFSPSASTCAGIPAAGQFSLPILFVFLFTKLQVALFTSLCSWLATSDLY